MTGKRILGVFIVLIGAALLFASYYVQSQVDAGKGQISSAQKNVDRANSLFSLSPATKDVGQGITGSIRQKIAEGQEQVDYYEQMARNLEIGGWAGIALGAVIMLMGRRRNS